MPARFYLSPSQVARYYFHECERYLRYRTASKAQRAADDIPAYVADRSLLTRAILEGGEAWEERILEQYLGDGAMVALGTGKRSERRHTSAGTINALREAGAEIAVYQGTLQAPPRFYERFGLDPELVTFADCHPDLLMVVETDTGLEVRVVDAKASEMMKLSHRVQVGLYALLLEDVLIDAGMAEDLPVARVGGVWLYQQAEPEWFDLSRVRGQLETFLAHDLPRILTTPAPDAFWHLSYRCEWCDFYAHCRSEADRNEDVSLVPYLSGYAKRHLRKRGVKRVNDFGELLQRPDRDALLAGCASLEGRAEQLELTVRALETEGVESRGAASVGMPRGENVLVLLTLQSEPLEGSLYAYGLYRAKGRGLFGSGTSTVARVARDGTGETLRTLRRSLVADLMSVLEPVHRHNVVHADDWASQKSIQAYVFDSYERDLLVTALLEATLDPVCAEDALALLFYFQHPDLVLAEDHPAGEVFFPVITLTSVVRNLLALPIPVVYRLADVVDRVRPSEYAFTYHPTDFFAFALSNRMKSNAVFEVWERGREDLIEAIERELRARLWAANSVISGLRERLAPEGALFAWPPKFSMPEGFGMADPVLSRLAFIARYESVLGYLDVRTARGRSLADRNAAGTSVELIHAGDGLYEADPEAIERARLEADGFPNFILTPERDEGRRARLAFDDFAYRNRMYPPRHLSLALASIGSINDGDIRLELIPSRAFDKPRPGDRYVLERRYTDWTTGRLIGELVQLDRAGGPQYSSMLTEPVAARRSLTVQPDQRAAAIRIAREHGMTRSQLVAFDGVLDHELQLVWGPPGTGKTHFLALAILCLLESRRIAGERLRVIVTAFTHTAIDNVIEKIAALQHQLKVVGEDLALFKLNGVTPSAARVNDREVSARIAGFDRVVIGSTAWQLAKCPPDQLSGDLVVVDEGSQVTAGEAAIPFRRRTPGGRLVIAGDPEQLPPIVQADYPTDEGDPPFHRSILECLRAGDDGSGLVAPLLENWRMNEALCEYPRQSIYPTDYHPATREIGERYLEFGAGSRTWSPFVSAALDPDFPVVVGVVENVQATRENPVEAGLVAELASALREATPWLDDDAFWRERLFVVSPHHAQIRLIKNRLRDRLGSNRSFVDTVDKMQGQECDVVIVSYGVSDVEYALGEQEFIYSRNRLNVAITRARVKTIVLISRQLLDPPIQALERDDVADGIALMQGLARHCEERGEPMTTDVEGIAVTLLRA